MLETLVALHRTGSTEFHHQTFGIIRASDLIDHNIRSVEYAYDCISSTEVRTVLGMVVIEMLARFAAIKTMHGDGFELSKEYEIWKERKKRISYLSGALDRQSRLEILEPLRGTLFEQGIF